MELDVYLNTKESSADQLLVFQYPLRPRDRGYQDLGSLTKVEHKSKTVAPKFKNAQDDQSNN